MKVPPRPIAEDALDVRFSRRPMWVRIYAPTLEPDGETWGCAYTIDAPVSVKARGLGPTSLQALVEAMRGVSRALYGSAAYKRKQIGTGGCFGNNLFFPATFDLLDIAPYPF